MVQIIDPESGAHERGLPSIPTPETFFTSCCTTGVAVDEEYSSSGDFTFCEVPPQLNINKLIKTN